MTVKRSATILISAASGFALLAAGTAAGAAIAGPIDSSGVIHACYANSTTNGQHAILLENVGTPCPAGMTAITWNQQGPAGATGSAGPAGPAGPAGAAGPQGPKGDTGAEGPAGPAGPAGPTGPAGADGSTVLHGTGAPGPSVGNDGDFYLDTAADVLYGPKAGGAWPVNGVSVVGSPGATGPAGPQGPSGPPGLTGPQGPAGANGNTVLNGAGAPGVSVGNDGDFYLDTAADVLYGPKAGGIWSMPGTSLAGPAGAPGTGATVAAEPAGANCANGGVKVIDGNGTTAYACTGATGPQGPPGSADLQPFGISFAGGQPLLAGQDNIVAGLVDQVFPSASSTYVVNAAVNLLATSGGTEQVNCWVSVDGALPSPFFPSLDAVNSSLYTSMPVIAAVRVTAGTHVIEVECRPLNNSVFAQGSMAIFKAS